MESKEWKKKDGGWEHNNVLYPKVAKIRADRLLKSPDFRGIFKPNDMVHYCDNLIYKEELGPDNFIYLASVKNVEGEDTVCRPIPLGLLEFTLEQKKEIMKKTKFPKSAFDKLPSRVNDEEIFDEPYGVELGGKYGVGILGF